MIVLGKYTVKVYICKRETNKYLQIMENKKRMTPAPVIFPQPIFVVGSYSLDGTPNVMTASFGGLVAHNPVTLYVSLRKETLTYKNVLQNRAFTVNIPSERYARESDFFGLISGRKINKFDATNLTAVKSEQINAPYIAEFPVIYECQLVKTVNIGSHTMFIGEVLNMKADETVLNKVGPVLDKVRPLILDINEKRYFGVGQVLDKAFSFKNEFPK